MVYSVVDIGTNTMLMLIAEFNNTNSSIKTLLDTQRVPRLGKGVDENKNIPPNSIDKAITVLNEYKKISQEYNSEKIIVTATSFLRDAHNRDEFLLKIKEAAGLDIEILSGHEEAKWTFWGGIYDQLWTTNEQLRICLIDIGGGSTEITFSGNLPKRLNKESIKSSIIQFHSLDIGSVRLKERFNISQPPSIESLELSEHFVNNELSKLSIDLSNSEFVGVAGTVTTLAAIKLNPSSYERDKIEGLELSLDEIVNIYEQLIHKELNELNDMGNYMEGRSDIIVTGILILKTFMQKFGYRKILISTKGLRYGILLREVLTLNR